MGIKSKPKRRTVENDFIDGAEADKSIVETELPLKEEAYKKLIVEIPASLHSKLKTKAVSEGRTIKWLVINALKNEFGD